MLRVPAPAPPITTAHVSNPQLSFDETNACLLWDCLASVLNLASNLKSGRGLDKRYDGRMSDLLNQSSWKWRADCLHLQRVSNSQCKFQLAIHCRFLSNVYSGYTGNAGGPCSRARLLQLVTFFSCDSSLQRVRLARPIRRQAARALAALQVRHCVPEEIHILIVAQFETLFPNAWFSFRLLGRSRRDILQRLPRGKWRFLFIRAERSFVVQGYFVRTP